MSKNPDISIIIPMYNAGNYIQNVINSIYGQENHSFSFEIIIIDDKSTDNSKDIVEEMQHNEVILIELQQNGGTARARNEGLKNAAGKWILFLDSDDKFGPNLFQQFEMRLQNDINVYVFSLISEFNDYLLNQTITKVIDKRSFGHFGTACNKFISREICLKFKEQYSFEDVVFIVDMMNKPELKIALIKDAFYIYNRKNNESKMANFNTTEYIRMYEYVYSQIEKSDKLTRMFILETFVGILFSKNMPFLMSLKIAIKTISKLYKYLPAVYFNGIRNNVRSRISEF
jgi:glycosyltransferase involved in cell wall biosynthesis